MRQWTRISHIFCVKEAFANLDMGLCSSLYLAVTCRCCVSSWRQWEEFHTFSTSSFLSYKTAVLQLRAARSFSLRLPLASALKSGTGFCKVHSSVVLPFSGTESGTDYWKVENSWGRGLPVFRHCKWHGQLPGRKFVAYVTCLPVFGTESGTDYRKVSSRGAAAGACWARLIVMLHCESSSWWMSISMGDHSRGADSGAGSR